MKFCDTIMPNRVITLNDPIHINSIYTCTLRNLTINRKIWNMQLMKFFTTEEVAMIIKYCNAKGFKAPSDNIPGILRITSSEFAKHMEKRLASIGILIPFSAYDANKKRKVNYILSRVHPVITICMQLPGDSPQYYTPNCNLSEHEKIIWICQGYLSCLNKGKTNIFDNDDNWIDHLRNQVDGSLFIIPEKNIKLQESLSTDIKYYLYFCIIYVDTFSTKKLTQ